MNFLLHRHLAARDLGAPAAGIGAMLPDLWRMVDRRVRPARERIDAPDSPAEVAAVLAGIEHHLAADRWFHGAAVFEDGERIARERFRAAGPETPKVALFAHVTWEMCLDGALVRREGLERTAELLREGFAIATGVPAAAAVLMHHFGRMMRSAAERTEFDAGMERLFAAIARGPWIASYRTGEGVAARLEGIRLRLGFGKFAVADRERLAEAIDDLAAPADAAVAEILNRPYTD
jgi:hypothetical protein